MEKQRYWVVKTFLWKKNKAEDVTPWFILQSYSNQNIMVLPTKGDT